MKIRKSGNASWFWGVFTLLLLVIILAVIFLPFNSFKSVFNHFSRDGNLSLLRSDNAIVIRFWLGVAAALLVALAYLNLSGKWSVAGSFFRESGKDALKFFSVRRLSRQELGFLVLVLLITAFAAVHRIAYINRPMVHDEAYTVVNFSDTFFHALTDYSLPNNHIFHTLLVVLSVHIWGVASWVVRLPAFIGGVLLVPGIYFLCRSIYDSWTGILAALLVAFAPDLVSYSVNARGYTLVALFSLIILILGVYVVRRKNRFAWGLIILFSALGLFTVPTMLFPFGILFTWLFFENLLDDRSTYSSRRDFLSYWLASGFGAVLLTVLLYTPVLIYTGPPKLLANSFVSPVPWIDLLDTWRARFSETWAAWTANVPVFVMILLGIGWCLALVFHRKISSLKLPLQGAAALWIITLLIVQRYNAWEKVWVFLLPLMLMWAAAGLMAPLQKIKWTFPLSLASILGTLLVLAAAWSTLRLIPKLHALLAQRGDVENAVLFLKNNMKDTDLVVVDWPDDAPYWFYFLEYKLDNKHFDKRIPYTQAWLSINPIDDQTIAIVMKDRGPDIPPLNLEAVKLVHEFGSLQLYLSPVK